MYRVTPVFEGNNLVASGVLMEAESVEDQGEGVLFCVYVYNVQPGIAIDYATGESWADGSGSAGSTAGQGTAGNGSSQNQYPDCICQRWSDACRSCKGTENKSFLHV